MYLSLLFLAFILLESIVKDNFLTDTSLLDNMKHQHVCDLNYSYYHFLFQQY